MTVFFIVVSIDISGSPSVTEFVWPSIKMVLFGSNNETTNATFGKQNFAGMLIVYLKYKSMNTFIIWLIRAKLVCNLRQSPNPRYSPDNKLESSSSSSSGFTFRLNSPFLAMAILPVSSETMMATASVCSVMPSAER